MELQARPLEAEQHPEQWRKENLALVEKLAAPAVPSAFPNASVRVCGYELEDICGASSVYGSG